MVMGHLDDCSGAGLDPGGVMSAGALGPVGPSPEKAVGAGGWVEGLHLLIDVDEEKDVDAKKTRTRSAEKEEREKKGGRGTTKKEQSNCVVAKMWVVVRLSRSTLSRDQQPQAGMEPNGCILEPLRGRRRCGCGGCGSARGRWRRCNQSNLPRRSMA